MSPTYVRFIGALVAAAALAACTDDGQSMIILKNQVPNDDCSVMAADSGTFITSGRIHPDATIGYIFTPVVKSLVEERAGNERRIFIEGADITLEEPDGTAIAAFGKRFSGNIEPGGLAAFGFEIVPTTVLDGHGEGLIIAKIQIYGTLSGGEVKSDVFTYPVEICRGCFENVLGPCSALEESYLGKIDTGSGCNPLQDGTVECCVSEADELVCPAVGPEPPPEGGA